MPALNLVVFLCKKTMIRANIRSSFSKKWWSQTMGLPLISIPDVVIIGECIRQQIFTFYLPNLL
jgi:hypothetical protein